MTIVFPTKYANMDVRQALPDTMKAQHTLEDL